MTEIYPDRLQPGDTIRIVSPSSSLAIIDTEQQKLANERLEELGFTVTFGAHVGECDDFRSSSVESRVSDLHEAFRDDEVNGVLTVIGGYNANQLLEYIDWSLIRENPKVFCGFSDITVLGNAMLAKCGLVNYSGLHYSSFGMRDHLEYSLDYFKKCLMTDTPMHIVPAAEWFDDAWHIDQDKRHPVANEGWTVINEGMAEGAIVGGNINTFTLLHGTEYMPDLEGKIVFIEDDSESKPEHFDRHLVSLAQQPGFREVQALVIGRFQRASKMSSYLLRQIISTKDAYANIPVIANVDFGHTTPIFTYPVGGKVEVIANPDEPSIVIKKH